jgi:asparagine synthase (glutamine-hydrolysing)
MCGIAGIVGAGFERRVLDMCGALVARGPDAFGTASFPEFSLALGHRRLSVIDLSEAGAQPMVSASGRYTIVYNGEIYNHRQMREALLALQPGFALRGSSDTELLLELIAAGGLRAALDTAVGMFAFALVDRERGELTLCRDRAGEKPLYYGEYGGEFFFCSELSGIMAAGVKPALDRDAMRLYFERGYYPAPYTVFEGFRKLPAGQYITINLPYEGELSSPEYYWNAFDVASDGELYPYDGSADEVRDGLQGLIREAVAGQMVSDVPLGAFLSGGTDSSLVVALMQDMSASKVHTFTIGFENEAYDEAVYAGEIAAHIGTDHTEYYISEKETRDLIPEMSAIYSEPFADSSQIATYCVSRLARKSVTVALSGDAGDELFRGYNYYNWGLWGRIESLPLRPLAGRLMQAGAGVLGGLGGPGMRSRAEKLRTAGLLTSEKDRLLSYAKLSAIRDMDKYFGGGGSGGGTATHELPYVMNDTERTPAFKEWTSLMMYADFMMYLPDDILTKVDRAAMAVSLETRIPLLDHRIIEYAWHIPPEMKNAGGIAKRPLKEILWKYVPRELLERPKSGFSVPLRDWLTGALRGWALELIADEPELKRVWDIFEGDNNNKGAAIWRVLVMKDWMRRWGINERIIV